MPDFISPAPDEHHHADDEQEAITELFGSLDWIITRLTTEVSALRGREASEVQRETTLRIRHLTELNETLRIRHLTELNETLRRAAS